MTSEASDTSVTANISSYAGFNTFKNDFILEGNTKVI